MSEIWMLISYGDFNKTKKLFSYDRFGVHTIPLFKDPEIANIFLEELSKVCGSKDKFKLCACNTKQQIKDTLDLITMVAHDLEQIIIDPTVMQSNRAEHVSIGEQIIDIETYRESLS